MQHMHLFLQLLQRNTMYHILNETERYMNYQDNNAKHTLSYHQGQEDFHGMVEQFLSVWQ